MVYVFEGRYVLELDLRAVAVEEDEGEGLRFVRQGDKDPAGEVVFVVSVLARELLLPLSAVEVEEEEDALDTFD